MSYQSNRSQTDAYQEDPNDWRKRREGYLNVPQKPTYAPVRSTVQSGGRAEGSGILAEIRLGSLIAAAGMVWTAYVATKDYESLLRLQIMPPGPIEVCALGILVWLHAKWRRSVKAN